MLIFYSNYESFYERVCYVFVGLLGNYIIVGAGRLSRAARGRAGAAEFTLTVRTGTEPRATRPVPFIRHSSGSLLRAASAAPAAKLIRLAGAVNVGRKLKTVMYVSLSLP